MQGYTYEQVWQAANQGLAKRFTLAVASLRLQVDMKPSNSTSPEFEAECKRQTRLVSGSDQADQELQDLLEDALIQMDQDAD